MKKIFIVPAAVLLSASLRRSVHRFLHYSAKQGDHPLPGGVSAFAFKEKTEWGGFANNDITKEVDQLSIHFK